MGERINAEVPRASRAVFLTCLEGMELQWAVPQGIREHQTCPLEKINRSEDVADILNRRREDFVASPSGLYLLVISTVDDAESLWELITSLMLPDVNAAECVSRFAAPFYVGRTVNYLKRIKNGHKERIWCNSHLL